jgi:hypothetical protein
MTDVWAPTPGKPYVTDTYQQAAGITNTNVSTGSAPLDARPSTTKGVRTINASKFTTESGDQTANLLASWSEVLGVSGRVQWVVSPGIYALTSPRNLFALRSNVEVILEGVEFTVASDVSTSGWDLSATDTYSYDNAIFYAATPTIDNVDLYGGLFTIGAEELSPFQIGNSVTHASGTVTNGGVRLYGVRQVGGNVIQILSMDDYLVDELYQEGTWSSGLSLSNSTGGRVKSYAGKRIGVSADFVTWNNAAAIVGKGVQDLVIASPRINYTGGTSILLRTSATKPLLRIATTDMGIRSAGKSGIEYQVGTDAATNSASEQLTISGGYLKGYQCAPDDEDHAGVQIAIAKTGGATVRNALVENANIDYVSPDETFSESTYTISGSYNTKKNVAATSVGATYGIQVSGVDADSILYNARILGNGVSRAKNSSILADHMAGGQVVANSTEWGGWGRSGGTIIPNTSAHGIFVNVAAELQVKANTIRNNNPGCVGSGSVRSQLIRVTDSYDIQVEGNNLRSNDTTTAASSWNHSPIGFDGSAFALTGYTGRTCSIKVGRNNIFGTYFGLSGPDGGNVLRQGGATGIITVYDDDYVVTATGASQAILGGVTTVIGAATSGAQTITLPDPTYLTGQKVIIKHAGLGGTDITVATAAGTLWPAGPTLTNVGQYGTWLARGTVWQRVA